MKVATIIVTYNRLELLRMSVEAHLCQSRRTDILLIVNNNSTDNTQNELDFLVASYDFIKVLNLTSNIGGSGGFYSGVEYIEKNHPEVDWVWLMDDDAIPLETSLEKMFVGSLNENDIYGSLPQRNGQCAWPNINKDRRVLEHISDFDKVEEVEWIPFLGFFISIKLVKKIGLPERDFFLAADDVEYSLRAKKSGSKIFIKSSSLIDHPCAESYRMFIGFRYITNLKLAPWKRYYDTRNRLLVSKKYYGFKYYFQTIPASFLRLISTLITEEQKMKQFKAFLAGFYDGLMSKSGKRHDYWKL